MLNINDANMLFKFENLNIKVLRIKHEFFYSSFPRHCHGKNLYELHFVPFGEGTLITDEGSYPLSENTIYVTGPSVYHEQLTSSENPLEEYCLQMEITPSKNAHSPIGDLILKNTFFIAKDHHSMSSYFELLDTEFNTMSTSYIDAVKSLSTLILVALARNYSGDNSFSSYEKSTPDYRRTSIVEESFFHEYSTITIAELSRRLGLSSRQTQRFLLKNFSRTFTQMLSEIRINKAREFISEGMSVKDAAIAVGYNDIRSLKRKL